MSVKFDGLEAILEALDGISDFNKVQQGIENAALLVERSARMKAPKEIAPSIDSKIEDFKVTVYTNYETAPYVEYGTGKFSNHPMGGRKETPWVYVEENTGRKPQKTIHTWESAEETAAWLREQGLTPVITEGSHPKPFMRPALDENKENILMILGEGLLND